MAWARPACWRPPPICRRSGRSGVYPVRPWSGGGRTSAIVRAETLIDERSVTIEAELPTTGRSRTFVNRQPVRRRSDLHDALRTTLFSPEDIQVVRGSPGDRRTFLDETAILLDPRVAASVDELDRVLRQRAALLKQSGGRLSPEVAGTLDVWDARLTASGTAVVGARESLADRLGPSVGPLPSTGRCGGPGRDPVPEIVGGRSRRRPGRVAPGRPASRDHPHRSPP